METLLTLLTFFSVVLVVVLGLLTYLNNPKNAANVNFLGICVGLSVWILANYLADHNIQGLFWSRGAFTAMTVAAVFFFGFAGSFPKNKNLPMWMSRIVLAFMIVLVVIEQTKLFIPNIFVKDGLSNVATGSLYELFPVFILFVFGGGTLILVRDIRKLDRMTRTRLNFVITGIILMALVAMTTNLILPSISGDDRFAGIGTSSTLIFVAFTAYAIVRHRLFDIRAAAARSVAYTLTIGTLTATYTIAVFVISSLLLGSHVVDVQVKVVYTALALVLGFSLRPVKLRFDKLTTRLFYQDAYDPQLFINRLNRVLVAAVTPDELLGKTMRLIEHELKVTFCFTILLVPGAKTPRIVGTIEKTFTPDDISLLHSQKRHHLIVTEYLRPSEEKLKGFLIKNGIAILAQLGSGGELGEKGFGFIALGVRKSGNSYGDQDLRVIEATSNELVIAIENALRFEEIQHFNITLQQRIEDATIRLRASNRKLKILDETKDDFISMASHQLRTPLTSVKGYISMILDGDAGHISELQHKLLNQSFISSQRMVYLISDMLNVSRLRTGKFIIELNPCDLAEVVKGEVDQLIETAKSRSLTLIYDQPEHFPKYMLDESKLRQVIMNFIDNAIYYTPAGGEIAIRLLNKPDSIELTVTDQGIGVPKQEQHRLFSKFFRADNAKKARPDGNGLGLFMAKKVVIAHGGAIIFKSQEGKGSTFGFTFAKKTLQAVS